MRYDMENGKRRQTFVPTQHSRQSITSHNTIFNTSVFTHDRRRQFQWLVHEQVVDLVFLHRPREEQLA